MRTIRLTTAPLPPESPRPASPVTLSLPIGGADATQDALRVESAGLREALVLWAGRPLDMATIAITHLIVPRCEASRLRLDIPLSERIQITNFLRAERLLAFADLHTHPKEAFLSQLDQARPFGIRDGFYAIVVPDFATGKSLERWAMYEAVRGDWEEVEVRDRIT